MIRSQFSFRMTIVMSHPSLDTRLYLKTVLDGYRIGQDLRMMITRYVSKCNNRGLKDDFNCKMVTGGSFRRAVKNQTTVSMYDLTGWLDL